MKPHQECIVKTDETILVWTTSKREISLARWMSGTKIVNSLVRVLLELILA